MILPCVPLETGDSHEFLYFLARSQSEAPELGEKTFIAAEFIIFYFNFYEHFSLSPSASFNIVEEERRA